MNVRSAGIWIRDNIPGSRRVAGLLVRSRVLERFYSFGREFAVVERKYLFRPHLNSLSIEAPGMTLSRILRNSEKGNFLDFGLSFPPGERVLLLGGGGFALARRALAAGWGKRVDSVELCPEIARVAEKYFFDGLQGRVAVHVGDAAEFAAAEAAKIAAGAGGKYDLVITDVFRGDELASGVYRGDFGRNIRLILNDGGAAVFNLGWNDLDTMRSCARNIAENFDCARLLRKRRHYFLVASSASWEGGDELEKSNPFFVRDLKKQR